MTAPAANVTPLIRVNLRIAQAHLDALGGGAFSFQTFTDKGKLYPDPLAEVFHGTLAQHGDTLRRLNDQGAGVFITVNQTNLKGRKAEHVIRVRANFVDLDGAPPGPPIEWKFKPDIVIETSPGRFHIYWLADETRAADLNGFVARQKKLIALFHADRKCSDLPRVLRLAGFIHRKANPYAVRIVPPNEWVVL
jgi:hypothetical protein